jgi:two-component system, chemotaxis family, CheB/CheR fusion protein
MFDTGPDFEGLLEYMRDARGFDFTGYKRASLRRRIARRCAELNVDTFAAYLDYLQVHPDEFPILFDRILINVTEFFRDEQAWDYLVREIIPSIVGENGPIRIWSTGTASGEEAYSAAIIFCEAIGQEQFLDRVKIYATDVDEDALNRARAGYTEKDLKSVDAYLRDKYFERVGGRFAFKTSLRRGLIFGRHDLMQDAPISRLDLLICRNTLMYFTAEAQGRILARFHYALNDTGFLFLGRAEMLLTHSQLFQPVDLKQRVFTKVPRVHVRDRLQMLAPNPSPGPPDQVERQLRVREVATEGTPYPLLVVDVDGILVGANPAARRMLDIAPSQIGRSLKDLTISYQPVDLRSPIDRALRDRRPMMISGAEVAQPDRTVGFFDVYVAPLIDDGGKVVGTTISFVDVTLQNQLRAELDRARHEIETAYEELQSSNEELETTNEELQSTVEELETTNEELQSSNEELETMNEELESTNSELQTMNSDLRVRSDEITTLNALLEAITGNIEVGAAVLDGDMRVRVWNERAADLWGLRSDEVVGHSFYTLDIGLPAKELETMIRSVIGGNGPHQEVTVDAITRRGRRIRCQVKAHMVSDGMRPRAVVLVMEELNPGMRD